MHRKQYCRVGNGVTFMCGDIEILTISNRLGTFDIDACPVCGMAVRTSGDCPDRDYVEEYPCTIPKAYGTMRVAM